MELLLDALPQSVKVGIDVVVIIDMLTWITAQGTPATAFKSHHACLTCAQLADEANGVFLFSK